MGLGLGLGSSGRLVEAAEAAEEVEEVVEVVEEEEVEEVEEVVEVAASIGVITREHTVAQGAAPGGEHRGDN